jgi:hypothetical protein
MSKGYGFHNHLVVNLGYQGVVTGNGSSAAISCVQFYLPVRSMLIGIYPHCYSCATGGTSAINVLADGNKVTTSGVSLSSGTTSGSNTSILGQYQKHDAGTIFGLCQNTTNSVQITNPGATLVFRTLQA